MGVFKDNLNNFRTAFPLNDCMTSVHIATWLSVFAGWCSTLLFLFRVNIVHHNCRSARLFFISLWLGAAGGFLITPFSFKHAPVGPGGLCIVTYIDRLQILPSLTAGLFDGAVYISISYRMINPYANQNVWMACKAFFTGVNSSAIAKALLRTGQLYILWACLLFVL